MNKSKYLFFILLLIILASLYLGLFDYVLENVKTGFFAFNSLKVGPIKLTSKTGVETINLSEILQKEELNYGEYTIRPKVINGTLSIILRNDKNSFFSRFKVDEIRSGPLTILDSNGNKKDYYLNIDANLSSNQEEEKSYIVEFKDPPLAVEKMELKKEMDTKISEAKTKVLRRTLKAADYEKSVKLLEVDMNRGLENYVNRIEMTHASFKKQIESIKSINKSELKEFSKVFNGISLKMSPSQLNDIKNLPYVEKVYEDEKVQAFLNDSVKQINATDVWKMLDNSGRNVTGYNVTIAIIDTGVDYTHPDLGNCTQSQFLSHQCSKVVGGYNFINFDDNPMDDNGHGTHVAGIAAANGTLKGVAPEAKIFAYKALNSFGSGYESDIISAIDMAVNHSVDIISMSLGEDTTSIDYPISEAIDNAVNSSIVVVVAAGNSGPGYDTISAPGNVMSAITVGAVNKNNSMADFSSRGPVLLNSAVIIKPDVVAPGVEICSAEFDSFSSSDRCIDQQHISLSGTSMAAPHVSGAVALLKQYHKGWTPDDIKSAIVTTATDLGYDVATQGGGLINVMRAINASILINPVSISTSFTGNTVPVNSTEIKIKNQRPYQITVDLNVEKASEEYEQSYNLSYLNTTHITIDANSESAVLLTTNMTGHGGMFFGRITMSVEGQNYTILYVDSWLIQLNVSVVANNMNLYPDIYIHDDEIGGRSYANQAFDFVGSNYTFLVPAGKNITVYAIGDESNEYLKYILMKRIEPPLNGANITLNLSSDSRPFTINTTALDGSDIKIYDLDFGFASYANGLPSMKVMYLYSFLYSLYNQVGNQVIYLSNKPDGPYDTDIILKYVGVPVVS